MSTTYYVTDDQRRITSHAQFKFQEDCKETTEQIIMGSDGFYYLKGQEPPKPEPTPEQLADTARSERDRLIEAVRWRIERHNDELALGREPTEPLEPLLQYVQDLRDVPQQAGFPESVEWPEIPIKV